MIDSPLFQVLDGKVDLARAVVPAADVEGRWNDVVFYDPSHRRLDREGLYVLRFRPEDQPVVARLQAWFDGKIGITYQGRPHAPEKMARREIEPLILGLAIARVSLIGKGGVL